MLKEPRRAVRGNGTKISVIGIRLPPLTREMLLPSRQLVDNHTVENGCMQLLSGSHRLGPAVHGVPGEQAGVDKGALGKAVKRFPWCTR